jgi:predicted PurR-regulated permease PerM
VNGVTASRGYRIALFSVGLIVGVLLIVFLRTVLLQLFVSALIAAGMAPLVKLLTVSQRRFPWAWHPSRALVVILIYAVAGLVVLVLGAIILNSIVNAANALAAQVPSYITELQSSLAPLASVAPSLSSSVNGTNLTQFATGALSQVSNAASSLGDVLGGIVTIVFIMFIALYLTVDAERVRDYTLVFLPLSRQAEARRLVDAMALRLGHWVAAQLLLCLVIGGGAAIGLGLIGVPGAALLGIVWAVAEFIPGIGPFISAVPSIALGFAAGPTVGVLAAIFTFVWSQFESNYITPRIMGRALQLSSLVVLIALMVGNQAFGLAGALVAIPFTAAVSVIVDAIYQQRLQASREPIEAAAAALTEAAPRIEPVSGSAEPSPPALSQR